MKKSNINNNTGGTTIDENPEKAERIKEILQLKDNLFRYQQQVPLSFDNLLFEISQRPEKIFRNIFQLFADMVNHFVKPESTNNKKDKEYKGFQGFNTKQLFVVGCDMPFFADRLFANRFLNVINSLKKGIQTNRIYFFEGPPGSGKSTFLNNLLYKLETYSMKPEGLMYRTNWHLDLEKLGMKGNLEKRLFEIAEKTQNKELFELLKNENLKQNNGLKKFIDISCPYNEHPVMQIPRKLRPELFDTLIDDVDFKHKLHHDRQYEWVFKNEACHFCSSMYEALFDILDNQTDVLNMVQAKVYRFNRKFGKGISVYNPGDSLHKKEITNPHIQKTLHELFKSDNLNYAYSFLAQTNNGVFAIMDIKENNIQRLKDLHGIISDGVNKIGLVEERIKSLFIGLVNPEDMKNYTNIKSFQDRVISVKIPYVLDYETEVKIYEHKIGEKIYKMFLPDVLNNFAKIIVCTRLDDKTLTIKQWVTNTTRYKFLDSKRFILKLALYSGEIPSWLYDDDIKKFTPEIKKKIFEDSVIEGQKGVSGRKSLSLFNKFYTKNLKNDKIVTMEMVYKFFKSQDELKHSIPIGFLESLVSMYDYKVLQQIKQSIYFYNKKQITKDILNYLFAINFEDGVHTCPYTKDRIEINEDLFKNFEAIFLGTVSSINERKKLRNDIRKEYITKTLAQEINISNKKPIETEQFKTLFKKYTSNLKENALLPYSNNKNFRSAILDYGKKQFKTYDKRLKEDVIRLLDNLQKDYKYSEVSAIQVCIYALDKKLTQKY